MSINVYLDKRSRTLPSGKRSEKWQLRHRGSDDKWDTEAIGNAGRRGMPKTEADGRSQADRHWV